MEEISSDDKSVLTSAITNLRAAQNALDFVSMYLGRKYNLGLQDKVTEDGEIVRQSDNGRDASFRVPAPESVSSGLDN